MVKKSQFSKIESNFSYIKSDRPSFGRCVVIRVKKQLCVVIRVTFFCNDARCLLFNFCISISEDLFLMNLYNQIKLDTLYKIATDTFSVFLTGNLGKCFFLEKNLICLNFAGVLLLGSKISWLLLLGKRLLKTTHAGPFRRPLISPRPQLS